MIGNTNKAKTMNKSGTISVSDNGLYDVTSYKTAQVNVIDKMSDYVNGSITEMRIPNNITHLRNYCFYRNSGVNKFVVPGTVISVGTRSLSYTSATEIEFEEGVTTIGNYAIHDNASLVRLNLPSSLTSVTSDLTWADRQLQYVTLGNNFNCTGVNLSGSTKYSRDTILGWFNALYDRSQTTTYTLTMGSTNLAKMTTDDIAIATAKNWTIA